MIRSLTARVAYPLALSLFLISGTVFGSSGGAPSLPEDSTQVLDSNVPVDGVVAAQSECGPCSVDEVWITAVDGTPVEGVATDLIDLRGVGAWAFSPSNPWVPGEYLAHYADGDPAPFTVLDERVSAPTVEPSLGSTITQSRQHVQCVSALPTAENPAGEFETFSLVGWTNGYFHPASSGAWKAQYTYLIGVNGEIRFDPYGTETLFEIGPGTDEICYWVRAQRLVSREETLLVDDCYSPAQLQEYVEKNPSLDEFYAFLRNECVLPPAGMTADWCSSFQRAIDEGQCSAEDFQNLEACKSALDLCVEGEPSSTGDGDGDSTTDEAGDSSDDEAGDSSDDEAGDSADDEAGDSSGGCAVSAARVTGPGQGGVLLAVLGAIAALRLRRKRQHQGF